MNKILLRIFLTLVLAIGAHLSPAKAAHLIGGELTYTCLGGNQFAVNLTIYRDCYCVSCAEFDNPAYITIFNASGGVVQNLSMFSPVIEQLSIDTEGLCLENAPDVCVERGFYTTTVSLPFIAGGYQIVHQRCCRNNTIVNILTPGSTGSTYVANVPESVLGSCSNSSPVFNNYPPIVVCANSPLVVNSSATDPDGDVLVYSICEPFSGASTLAPQPITASTPPYATVTWVPPYSGTNQLGGSPVMSIDPTTGILTAFPTQIGQYVVGICVSEYRDGVLISTNLRDFQFNVTECQVVLAQAQIASGGNNTICPGESVQLLGSAFGGDMIMWAPGTGLSNTSILNPIASPSQTTTYTLTVINPFVGCEDSATITIFVADDVAANAGPDVEFCPGDAVQLGGAGTVGAVFEWSPAEGLSDPTVANPIAFPTQTITYTLTVIDATGTCTATDVVTLTLGSNADAGTMPADEQIICAGQSTNVSTSGASLGNGDVLAYVLHTLPGDVLGSVLAVNTSGGIFNLNSNPTLNAYATYYISAVAGPQGSTPGVPDFTNACTKVAPGTPVIFLAPVTFVVNEFCDWTVGEYHLIFTVIGGYPQYDPTFVYTIQGDYFGPIAYGETIEIVFPEGATTAYALEALSDGFGCTGAVAAEEFYCIKTPITLLNFYGKALPQGNQLHWTTATETDNDFFTLQRSTNGIDFNNIAQIKGAGNSITNIAYQYLDQNAPAGLSYYRLLQTDFNGTQTASNIISLHRQRAQTSFAVTPVPTTGNLTLTFDAQTEGIGQIALFDVAGKLLQATAITLTPNAVQQTSLSIEHLPAGLYLLQLTTPTGTQTAKAIKQ